MLKEVITDTHWYEYVTKTNGLTIFEIWRNPDNPEKIIHGIFQDGVMRTETLIFDENVDLLVNYSFDRFKIK